MKTIRQAAREYAGMGAPLLGEDKHDKEIIHAFTSGVNFAQRWISVKDMS
jgi:hypothetical protein